MLSDEEKKAIERIDYIQDFIIENGQYNADVNDMQYFSKVLNIIEKQSKEIEKLIQRNKDLEEIEKEHKEENGRLREGNKKIEKELEEKDMQHELELIGKEEFTKANMAEIIEHYYTANENCIPISKLKEIVDECIPKKENIITKELEYAPKANDNSYLTQRILELLEESD